MPKFLDSLLVARTLVDLQQKQIPLRVMNLSNQPQMINKGTQLAVLDQTEHREVHHLLCEFADIFSTGPHDLGCTDLVKHRINTGEAPPIRQPLRRFPLSSGTLSSPSGHFHSQCTHTPPGPAVGGWMGTPVWNLADISITDTVEPLYNEHFGTSHFWVIFADI